MTRAATALIALTACLALPAAAHGAEAWLTAEPLSKAGTYNDQARLATNSPGRAAVIWTEFANGRDPRFRIRVSTREPNEKWEPSEQLSGAGEGGSGAIGVDPLGRVTAVWDEAGKLMWATKAPGAPWTAAQAIPDGDGGNPDLFVASNGTATAVWQRGTTADTLVIRTARRAPGGGWSDVETISPAWSYRPHIEGDTAGDVTVSYTHDVSGGSQRYIYAVDRPNSGPWGTQTPVGGPAITDNISDLVVAPNSGRATVFWQNGSISDPLAARTRAAGTPWSGGETTQISGGTAGRLDLDERDRAAVDGTGLVTAAWIADRKVLTARRPESGPGWIAPTPPAEIDPGDGSTALANLQIASSAFGRAFGTWTALGVANRWSLRGAGASWSAPKAIDGVPADAAGLDLAVDGAGRVSYVWLAEDESQNNVASLAISTYGNPLSNPLPPAPPGPAPSPSGTSAGGSGSGGAGPAPPSAKSLSAKAKLKGKATTARGVTFVVTMPAAGTGRIVLTRAGKAGRSTLAAAKFRRVGVVRVRLKQGRNVVRVKRVRKRKLARGRYRATITAKTGGRTLAPVKVSFTIRR